MCFLFLVLSSEERRHRARSFRAQGEAWLQMNRRSALRLPGGTGRWSAGVLGGRGALVLPTKEYNSNRSFHILRSTMCLPDRTGYLGQQLSTTLISAGFVVISHDRILFWSLCGICIPNLMGISNVFERLDFY